MVNFDNTIVYLEKLLDSTSHIFHNTRCNQYCFNSKSDKNKAQNIIENDAFYQDDGAISELFRMLYDKNKKESFKKLLTLLEKKQYFHNTMYFYNKEQKDFFLSQAKLYIINNLKPIDNFKAYLVQIDEKLIGIYKEKKQYMFNGHLPEAIPEKFDNLLELYEFFHENMDLEHLNREENIETMFLLWTVIDNEEANLYYYSKDSFKIIQNILNEAIAKNDIFVTHSIICTRNTKLNCFLIKQQEYYQFAFINLLEVLYIDNATTDYELQTYKNVLNMLVDIFYDMCAKDVSGGKIQKLYFSINYIKNWKHQLQGYLLRILQKKIKTNDLRNLSDVALQKKDTLSIYFLFIALENRHPIKKEILQKLSFVLIEEFMAQKDNLFRAEKFKDFDFRLLFRYVSSDKFIDFCKTIINWEHAHGKYQYNDYFDVLYSLYDKKIENDLVDIVLNFAKTDYGLNLGCVSEDNFISLVNFFDIVNFQKIIKKLNSVDGLLQIYSRLLDGKKRNEVKEKLENIEITMVSKDSAFLAKTLGFNDLSQKILKMLRDDETSKFVKCKTQMLNIYKDERLDLKEKIQQLDDASVDVNAHYNKEYCNYYKSFLKIILYFKTNPEYVCESLKKLFSNNPQHIYLVNIASSYMESVKNNEDRLERLEYFIDEFKLLLLKLQSDMIIEEYEILLYLYNETNNYMEFEKLWNSLEFSSQIVLSIIKIRIDFLLKKLQSTEAMSFLDKVKQYYTDRFTLQEIEKLELTVKSNTKIKLEGIGMRFEDMTSETKKYDVALSFAGEQREYVEKVANELKEKNIKVFYDDFKKEDLWGKNLIDYFHDVYLNKSKYVIMFISKEYAMKKWTKHERESAQEREFEEDREYILPVRFDDTKISGFKNTKSYLSTKTHSPKDIADIFEKKFFSNNS